MELSNFIGVDDSTFQPGIVRAAKEFLDYYKVDCQLYDFNASFAGNYEENELFGRIDIVTSFGVTTYDLLGIAKDLLKPGGYYIFETLERRLVGYWEEKYEFVKCYEKYGRAMGAFNIMVLRRKNETN